jgi:hypothetical protein
MISVAPDQTQGHTHTHTLGRASLDKRSAHRRNLCLTTHSTHKRQTSVPSTGFEPAVTSKEQSQTHVLDRAATGTSQKLVNNNNMIIIIIQFQKCSEIPFKNERNFDNSISGNGLPE